MAITLNGTTGITNGGGYTGDGVSFADGTPSNTLVTDTSGNVGIGTSSPTTRLDIVGTGNPTLTIRGSDAAYTGTLNIQSAGGGSSTINATGGTGTLNFQTGSSDRMRIDSAGRVLIGVTAAVDSMPLQLASTTAGQLLLRRSDASAGLFWRVGPDSASNNLVVFNQNGTGVYITNGATSWSGTSDERLKTDLTPITDAVNKVSTLRAVTGRFKTDEEGVSRSFLIAQDVQAVLPEAVDVRDDEQGTLGIRYIDTIPLLVAAIKEQQAIITDLKARIETLENK